MDTVLIVAIVCGTYVGLHWLITCCRCKCLTWFD